MVGGPVWSVTTSLSVSLSRLDLLVSEIRGSASAEFTRLLRCMETKLCLFDLA